MGGWIHPVSSHANLPDDSAEVIETMWGYLRGKDCSRKLVVTVRVLVWVWGPVIHLQTTRGASHNHASPHWTRTLLRLAGCRPTAKCTYTQADTCTLTHTCTLNQTHSCLLEFNAGWCPTVIKAKLLWRHRHRTNTQMISHTYAHRHMWTHTFANCLFPLCSLSVHMVYRLIRRVRSLLLIYRKNKPIGRRDRKTATDRHKHRQTRSHGSRHEVSNTI